MYNINLTKVGWSIAKVYFRAGLVQGLQKQLAKNIHFRFQESSFLGIKILYQCLGKIETPFFFFMLRMLIYY